MRVAIIGAGLQGNRRADSLRSFPGSDLVIVTAKERSKAEPLARRVGCEAGAGWEDVVRRSDIDAVVVCTPPHLHAEITLAALAEDKHVLCEKPLARTVEEAEAMVNAAAEKRLILKCGFNHRYHPAIQAAHQRFAKGLLGKPVFLRSRYGLCGRPGYEKEWRADPAMVSGGQLMEQGIHVVDLFRWFLGELADVTAVVETRYWTTHPLEDNAFAIYRTRDGAPASLHSSVTQWKNLFSFEVYGEEGYVSVEGLGGGYGTEFMTVGRRVFNEPFATEVTEFRGPDICWREEWKEFTDSLGGRRPFMGGGRDGLEAMRLVFAAYESARRGARISLTPASAASASSPR